MLCSLSIENYALIRKLDIPFRDGLTVITGETGAGKSIILGALGLILGSRADTSILPPGSMKCTVEGVFEPVTSDFLALLNEMEVEQDNTCLLRREIHANGKSRAFINDSPVSLAQLKMAGEQLVDIHSQHETLFIRDAFFQLEVLDQYARTRELLALYRQQYLQWQKTREKLRFLKEKERQSVSDQDYNQFLLTELDAAAIGLGEQESLEEELEILTHAEEIQSALRKSLDWLDQSDRTILSDVAALRQVLEQVAPFHPPIKEYLARINAIYLELKDITGDLNQLFHQLPLDPSRLDWVQKRLDLIYTLQQKHKVHDVAELTVIATHLRESLNNMLDLREEILQLELQESREFERIARDAEIISHKRNEMVPSLVGDVDELLRQMGMPNARFVVDIVCLNHPDINGIDQVNFLFSANKGVLPGDISRMASGGELSRLMLAIKSLVGVQQLLPTMIFDEIDMGISGEIAARVGQLLLSLAASRQLIVITHLPQIAGKGQQHYLVYKSEEAEITTTGMRILSRQERVEEIAHMISGDALSKHAIETARELLQNN